MLTELWALAAPQAHALALAPPSPSPSPSAPSPPAPAQPASAAEGEFVGHPVSAAPLRHEILATTALRCSAALLLQLLLAERNPLLGAFFASQGATQMEARPWQPMVAGGECQLRVASYVIPVTARLSPVRQTAVQETQRAAALPGGGAVLQLHQVYRDVPFAERFSVHTKLVATAHGGVAAAAADAC